MKFQGQAAGFGYGSNQNGFTLLEVIVAGSILAVGLTAVVGLYDAALRGLILSKRYEEARLAAQSVMAEILFESPEIPFQRTGKCIKPVNGLWEVSGEPDDYLETVAKISVRVRFQANGTQHSIHMLTSHADWMLPGNPDEIKINKGG